MSIIVSNCQHCEENNFEHCHVYTTDFLSSKVKFIHTSTVILDRILVTEKNYAYASRAPRYGTVCL